MSRHRTSGSVLGTAILACGASLFFASRSFAAEPPAAPTHALAAPASPASSPDQLLNARDPLSGVRTGGVPDSIEVFGELASEGFRTFVDLRPEAEASDSASAGARAAGMSYVRIPVATDADLDLGTARALDAVLDDPTKAPLVIACASGNRSGALLAVRAFWLEGRSAEEALALGKAAGLTRLEPSVRQLLGLPALPAPPAP